MVVMPVEVKSHTKEGGFAAGNDACSDFSRRDDNQNFISNEEPDAKNIDGVTDCLFDLDPRFFRTACNLVGYIFRVKTSEGRIFEGILETFDPNFDVALSLAHEIKEGSDEELPHQAVIKEKMIFSRQNIVTLAAVVDADSFSVQKTFATDSEIGRINGGATGKTLQAWEPDAHGDDENFVDCEDDFSEGWTAEEMFERNNKNFGVVSTFEEKLTQFSNVRVEGDESSPEYRKKLAHAERVAQSIMANPASLMAAALENDDEERDIVLRAPATHAVVANVPSASKATSPPPEAAASSPVAGVKSPISASGPGAPVDSLIASKAAYVPPNKRKFGPNQKFSKPVGPFSRPGQGEYGPKGSPQQQQTHQSGQTLPSTRPNKVGSIEEFGQQQQGSPGYHGNAGPVANTAMGPIPSAVFSRSRYPQQQGHYPPQQGGQQQSPVQYPSPTTDWDRKNHTPYNKRGNNANSAANYTSKPQFNNPSAINDNSGPANLKRFSTKNQRGGDREQNFADLRKFGSDFQLVPPPPPSAGSGGAGASAMLAGQAAAMQSASPVCSAPVQFPPPQPPPHNMQQPPPLTAAQQRRQSPPVGGGVVNVGGNGVVLPTSLPATTTAPPPPTGAYKQRSPPRGQLQAQAASKFKPHNEPPPSQQQRFFTAAPHPPPPSSLPPQPASSSTRPQTLSASAGSNFTTQSPSLAAGVASPLVDGGVEPSTAPQSIQQESTEHAVSKLNPDAKEFCPSSQPQPFYRPTPVQTPVAAPSGAYPAAVQSPSHMAPLMCGGALAHPQQPMALAYHPQQSSSPQLPPNSGNGDFGNGAPVLYQTMAGGNFTASTAGGALYAQPPPPPPPNISSLPLSSGAPPLYTINAFSQPALAILHNNGSAALRPYKMTTAGAQPGGVGTAGGQPMLTAAQFPGNAGASYLVQYGPNAALQQGGVPQPQYFISTAPRMQYVLPQGAMPSVGDNGQQQVYTVAHANSASGGVPPQPVMTAPYAPGPPYVLQYSPLVMGQTHQGAVAYQPSQCVFGTQRMPYLVPQQAGQPLDNNQQQVYVASFPQQIGAAGYPPLMRSSSVTGYNQPNLGPSGTPSNHSNA